MQIYPNFGIFLSNLMRNFFFSLRDKFLLASSNCLLIPQFSTFPCVFTEYYYIIHKMGHKFMNAMKSGSPWQNIFSSSNRISSEMLSLTRSKDVLVKKCGYVPFYMRQLDRLKIARVYLPISPISPILRRDSLKSRRSAL